MNKSFAPLLGILLLMVSVNAGCASSTVAVLAEEHPAGAPSSVSIYTLSKGKGVPEPTRQALQKVRSLLQSLQGEKQVGAINETRIGLEGETRVCVDLKDAGDARALIEKLRAIAAAVELMNITEESEPCKAR